MNLTILQKQFAISFLFFTTFCTHIHAERIALFYNSDYTQVEDGNIFAEGSNLHASLVAQGHVVYTFEGYEEADFLAAIANNDILIIPEMENRGLHKDISDNAKAALRNYVECGGALIINGVVSSSSIQNKNALELINRTFGFGIQKSTVEISGTSRLDASVASGTAYQNAPAILLDNSSNVYLKAATLPTGTKKLYYQNGDISKISVADIPFGKGSVLYLGWSWWNAKPYGDLDGGWFDFMDIAIANLSCSPNITIATGDLVLDLNDQKLATIDAATIANSVSIECGELSTIDIFPNEFSCNEIGQQVVLITVQDDCGRTTAKTINVNITDTNENCKEDPLSGDVVGTIKTEMGDGIEDVSIGENEAGIPTQITNETGSYILENVSYSDNYIIQPKKDINILNGVTTYDLHLIAMHILGVRELDSPYKMIAADVDHSGTITGTDILLIRQLVLSKITEFPNNKSWRFVDASYQFSDPKNPFATSIPETYQLSLLPASGTIDFIGVKIGDINNNVSPNHLQGTKVRNATALEIAIEDKSFKAGEEVSVKFNAQQWKEILGFQFALDFDSNILNYKGLENTLLDFNEKNINAQDGTINFSWDQFNSVSLNNETVFELKFIAKANGKLSEVLQLNTKATQTEAFNSALELMDVSLNFFELKADHISNEFTLLQNFPNPFKTKTTIQFNLPKAGDATLSIFDIEGRLVKTIYKEKLSSGMHEIELLRAEFPANGQLIYRLDSNGFSSSRKMLLVE